MPLHSFDVPARRWIPAAALLCGGVVAATYATLEMSADAAAAAPSGLNEKEFVPFTLKKVRRDREQSKQLQSGVCARC